MKNVFDMSNLGEMNYFLGLEVQQSRQGIIISQSKYAKEILRKFQMIGCKSSGTLLVSGRQLYKEDRAEKLDSTKYRSLVGCLLYLSASRPDIRHATSLLSRYMHSLSELHFNVAKKVLRYVKGTMNLGSCTKRATNSFYQDILIEIGQEI